MSKFLGYQIVDEDTHDIPKGYYSFTVIKDASRLTEFFKSQEGADEPCKWIVIPIFEGDVEEPTFV